MYCASGTSFPSNYQVQGTISPPASFTPLMFPVKNVYFQGAFYPFPDMLPNASTTAFPPSDNSGQNAQTSPVPFAWPLPMQPLATASQQQPQCQVPQEGVAEMEPPRESRSVYREGYQPNVAFHAAPSAPEMSLQRLENQPGFQLPAKHTMSKNRRKGQMPTQDQRGADEYYCEPCDNWFPIRMKKRHDKKHDGDHVCRICEILERACRPLSRKDALKRHVEKKHPDFKHLLKNVALRILVPRRKNVPEDLQELKQAMFPTL
ncbi:hypothetical protein OG21DRAFT_321086 [Imleria badia]|nr:hypothetical protein OG21DRAFT_321086 [Imleria badia]